MISKLSKQLVDKLVFNNAISKDELELYAYGSFVLLSQLMYFTISFFLGILLGCILESIIFYISFQFIRRYAGGYHESTEARCEILSTLSILTCVVVIKFTKIYDFQTALLIISVASAVCVFFLCPIDTAEKPLSEKEFKYFRKVSLIILFAIIIAIAVSYIFKFRIATVPCCLSLILESILLVLGKIKRGLQTNNVKS